MSNVVSRSSLALAVATAIGFLAPAALAGTATNQQPFASQKERSKTADADDKSVAEKAAHYEAVHQDRMARIRRLLAIYKEKGDTDKVTELQTMRDKLEKRHTNAMQKFREQLGEDRWTKVENQIRTRKAERTPADVRKPAQPRPQEKPQERPKESPPEKKRPAPPR